MKRRAVRATFATFALLAVVALGAIALRSKGTVVRVHVETIRDEDGHYHRRWTFTGGRWESYGQGVRGNEHFVVLDPPGARAGVPIRFIKEVLGSGADRLVYEVEADRPPEVEGKTNPGASVVRTLLGNANRTPRFRAKAPLPPSDLPWSSRFRTTLADDGAFTVPARIKLGVIDGLDEVIEFR